MVALGLVALTVCSCRRAEEQPAIGHLWLEALNSHDPEQVAALLAPSATFSDPVTMQPATVAEYRAQLTWNWIAWKDRLYLPRRMISAGDGGRVVVEWQLRQTHASGASVPVDGVTVLDTAGGRITAVREYYDPSVYLPFLKASEAQ